MTGSTEGCHLASTTSRWPSRIGPCADGSLYYEVRPFRNTSLGEMSIPSIWVPEMFGTLVLANGKVWPFKQVETRAYRLRVLDGSNARFYHLRLADHGVHGGPSCAVIHQMATDGGYLDAPVLITPPLLMALGERRELIVDLSKCAPGTVINDRNNAAAPFAGPEDFDGNLGELSYIMQFRVLAGAAAAPFNAAHVNLHGRLPDFERVDVYRSTTIIETEAVNELTGKVVPIEMKLNNLSFHDPTTEFPKEGKVERWDFISLSADTHPLHMHLVQFQVVARFDFVGDSCNCTRYEGASPDPYVAPCVPVAPITPPPEEHGWKDTVLVIGKV
eukprot:jgi/Mesvir1/19092/Mv12843-RA.1